MRKFDSKGLALTKFQADIFEKSVSEFPISSPYFIRRYLHSNVLKEIESKDTDLLCLDVNEGIRILKEELGSLKYGSIKYSKETMFWIGYIYAYICYTRQCRFSLIYRMIDPSDLASHYHVWHTQSEEWCIAQILERHGNKEEYFDDNYRLKKNLEKQCR